MQLFGDFEAINNQHIVAAAFVSADGRYEEHWLMKPFPLFRRLEGYYAQLLPYRSEDLVTAPALKDCRRHFQRIIASADKIWFYDRNDLKFFQESFPGEAQMQIDFSARYADAKALVEEVLAPVYIRDLQSGEVVNIRRFLEYLEQHQLNAAQESEFYDEICGCFYAAHIHLRRDGWKLEKLLNQLLESDTEYEAQNGEPLTLSRIYETLERTAQTLHPQRLMPREQIKHLRWLRSRLGRLRASGMPHQKSVQRLQGIIDVILEVQNDRLTIGKLSLPRVKNLIDTQNLPLEVIELFDEAELDRNRCLELLDRGIGLQTAASLLLTPEDNSLEGDEHNALYDSRLLRLVCLDCFARLKKLASYLYAPEGALSKEALIKYGN